MKSVLIVDDEPASRYGLRRALENRYRIVEADSAGAARSALATEHPDLILLDVILPGEDGISFLKWLREDGNDLPVLMVSALDTAKTAVEALQLGAADYLVKGFDIEELRKRVGNMMRLATLERENSRLRERLVTEGQFGPMLGSTPEMRKLFEMAARVAETDATVLILGESGTGKDLLAQEIHTRSPRAGRPFVAVNCAALPENLIESELFGHVKGAFTGAIRDKVGRFELAQSGTLFLDEIGELKPELQVKLLRVLETRVFERVGGTRPIPLEARIIAATSRNLLQEVRRGRFRMDLLYRLRTVSFYLPPLRERQEDIPLLVNHLLARLNRQYGKEVRGVDPKVIHLFQHYSWPGNIRELERVLEYAFVFVKGAVITKDHLPELESPLPKPPAEATLDHYRGAGERLVIQKALQKAQGRRERAARLLGISRSSLWRKMKAYSLL